MYWIKQYILYHAKRHPQEMGVPEIEAFLTYLAAERKLSGSTLNLVRSALLFPYREVLNIPIDSLAVVQVRRRERLPNVLTREEAKRVLDYLPAYHRLLASEPFFRKLCRGKSIFEFSFSNGIGI